jgi:hypothetical protein
MGNTTGRIMKRSLFFWDVNLDMVMRRKLIKLRKKFLRGRSWGQNFHTCWRQLEKKEKRKEERKGKRKGGREEERKERQNIRLIRLKLISL